MKINSSLAMCGFLIASALIAMPAEAVPGKGKPAEAVPGKGNPQPSALPVPPDQLPTPAERVSAALIKWIEDHPNPNEGKVDISADGASVVVHWKGPAPAELKALAGDQGISVKFRSAAYSRAELQKEAATLGRRHIKWLSKIGPNHDLSGIALSLNHSAPADAKLQIESKTTIPITINAAAEIQSASRNADFSPFYGGSLIRSTGVSNPQSCGTGAAVSIGDKSYISTAWHCGLGTWVSYNDANVLGKPTARNYHQDIQLIEVKSYSRMYLGDWKTEKSAPVYGTAYTGEGRRMSTSASASGVETHQRFVNEIDQFIVIPGVPDIVGPGFTMWPNGYGAVGTWRKGDSGSPVYNHISTGAVQIFGFFVAVIGPASYECQANPHPDWVNYQCYKEGFAVYARNALKSLGATIKVGLDPAASQGRVLRDGYK